MYMHVYEATNSPTYWAVTALFLSFGCDLSHLTFHEIFALNPERWTGWLKTTRNHIKNHSRYLLAFTHVKDELVALHWYLPISFALQFQQICRMSGVNKHTMTSSKPDCLYWFVHGCELPTTGGNKPTYSCKCIH